jgi:endonuclease/exonuclease/phosphatase (EEP) superfamily protein YafD
VRARLVCAVLVGGALPIAVGACSTAPTEGAAIDAGTVDAGPRGPAFEVGIATWNLREFPYTTTTTAAVAGLVPQLGVDLVALQELTDLDAFDDLVAALPGWAGTVAEDPGAFLRVGLLHRTDRVVLRDVDTLFREDGYGFPRPPLKAHVTVSSTSGPGQFDFVVVVLHLKAQGDEQSRQRRRAAAGTLSRWVEARRAEGPEQDFVLLGDFNDGLTGSRDRNPFLAFLDHLDRFEPVTLPLERGGWASYVPFERMIDHVVISDDARVELGDGGAEVIELDRRVPGYLETISDHRPVRVRFRVPLP